MYTRIPSAKSIRSGWAQTGNTHFRVHEPSAPELVRELNLWAKTLPELWVSGDVLESIPGGLGQQPKFLAMGLSIVQDSAGCGWGSLTEFVPSGKCSAQLLSKKQLFFPGECCFFKANFMLSEMSLFDWVSPRKGRHYFLVALHQVSICQVQMVGYYFL